MTTAAVTSNSDSSPNRDNPISTTPLFDLIFSPLHSATLLIFGRLRLFDFIKSHHKNENGVVSVEDVASHCQWSLRATSGMMVSLVSSGLLLPVDNDKDNNNNSNDTITNSFHQCYKLTPLSEKYLCSDQPNHLLDFLELCWEMTPQKLLEQSVADKKQEHKMLGTVQCPSKEFIDAMQSQTSHAAMTLSPLLAKHLQSTRHFVDVAGGSGTFCIEVCQSLPSIKRGTVYELEGVCPMVTKYVADAGMSDRIIAQCGNMFSDDRFPPGDAYAFGNVLHDWSDEVNRQLLVKAYASLPDEKDGTVVILEMLLDDDFVNTATKDNGTVQRLRCAAGLNLLMVLYEDGRHYKLSELEGLLVSVGFVDVECISSPLTPYSVVLGRKKKKKKENNES